MSTRICNFFVHSACMTMLSVTCAFAQQDVKSIDMEKMNELKKAGLLNGSERFVNYSSHNNLRVSPSIPQQAASTTCDCWLPRDASWQIGQFDASGGNGGPGSPPNYRNDDWSTDTLILPFNFCFYGSPVTKVFLNNNGNVSIGAPYSTYSAVQFPTPNFVMIAPFWADVDTRALGSGVVYYKLTPTYLAVQWDHVGYFNAQDDKLNTFQLIMSDGLDSILPVGQNVSFCYQDMQWTTGSASQGVNGFGGIPATVGVNKGTLTDFIQIGRYDTAGIAYDGPFGNADGISSLDNQSFYLNVCFSGSNVPPIINALQICDTLLNCQGDTLLISANYLSPEQNQITTASLNANGVTGVTLLNATSGNTASIAVQVVGQASNAGLNTIYISGTDNGTPSQTTTTAVHFIVLPGATAAFTFSPASPITIGTSVAFTNTSTNATVYSWDFGDGSATSSAINPVHVFNLPGLHTITLTATNPNGCQDIYRVQIQVNTCVLVNILSAGNVCDGVPLQVSYAGDASSWANFNWNFGGGTIVSGSGRGPYMIQWNAAGNYTLNLTVIDTANCTVAAAPIPVTVNASPVATVAATPVLCTGQQNVVTFTGTAVAGANYNWNFGNATVVSGTTQGPYTLQWNNAGNDIIHLAVLQNGCSDTTSFQVQINAMPTAAFTVPPSVCAGDPLVISFTGSALSTATYLWNFNGGTVHSGSGQGPYSVSWNSAGGTSVSLTVIQNGCSSPAAMMPVTVNAYPVASMTSASVLCTGDPDTITFTGTAIAGALFNWNFANAIVFSGSGQGPYVVHWNNAGADSIHLVVSQNGCIDQFALPVLIHPMPGSSFSIPPSVCINHPLTIAYTGSTPASANYSWNFDGATVLSGSGQGPYSVSWDSARSPDVSLTVTQNGCVSTATNHSLIVSALPAADAGMDEIVCAGNNVQIGSPAQPGLAYQWLPVLSLSSPNASSTSVVTTTASSSTQINSYILTTTNVYGCVNRDTVSVTINPTPVVNFSAPPPQCYKGNSFHFTSSGNLVAGTQYNWTFGSHAIPDTVNQQNPPAVHFTAPGSYVVRLNASANGCPAVPSSDQVTVYPNPSASFLPSVYEGCAPLDVHFNNYSTGGNTYSWNFSDHPRATDVSPDHVFMNAGTYTVALIATSDKGCADDTFFISLITVHPLPIAAFEPSPPVAPIWASLINFDNTSNGAIHYEWDFGDGAGSGLKYPSHVYNDTGTYQITLYVTSPFSCRDTVKGLVRIEYDYTFYIPNAFTPNGDGVNDFFRGQGTFMKTYEMNIFNRWGVMIYSTNDYNQPWDGKVNDFVQNDVYVYRIRVTDEKDKMHEYIGHVTLIR